MKHGTHPSPRQRLFATVASAALALLLFAAYLTPLSSAAQNPFAHKGLCDTDPLTQPCGDQGFNSCGQIYFHPYPGGITTTLSLTDTMLYTNTPEYTDTCMAPFKFSWSRHDAPVGNSSGTDVSKYPTMRGGPGSHTFYITFGRQATTWVEEDWLVLSRFPNDINIYWSATQRALSWDLFVDGVQSGTVEIVPGTQEWAYPGYNTYDGHPYLFVKGVWKVTYTSGSAYGLPNNVREFALRPKILYTIGGIPATSISNEEFRFKAVMVGSEAVAGTEDGEYGTFETPLVPNMILHDPPGDGSSTSLTSTEETCTGRSYSVAFDNSNDNFFNVRLGYSGSVGVAVEVDLEIWAQFTTNSTAGITNTEAGDYQSCFTTATTISTPDEGLPDDQFFASAIKYQYGWVKTVARSGCSAPLDTAQFVAAPIQVLASQQYSESFLRGVLVPALQVQVATLVQGTPAWQGASDQLEVWEQALALNDSIKANAELVTLGNIQAPSSIDYELTTTTETSRSIDCNVYLERGLNFEAGFSIAGNGLSGGYGVRFRQEFGKGSSTSSAQTNTLSYTLADGTEGDYINVEVRKDPVFGHPVFNTIPGTAPLNTKTSCPYEGGYQREQPQLWVGQQGSSTMVLNEVPIGGVASFPLLLCNNSDEERTYFLAPIDQTAQAPVNLAVATETNLTQANPIQFTIPANSCLPLQTLGLTQNGLANLDYNGLVLQLYSDCEPEINSSVTISANFGVGNTADYCEPASTLGTSGGNWIDGVQIRSINNTGTGGITGPAYTNYAAQYSTPLSRNALTTLSVTSGASSDDRYAAWIDYDRDGTFETDEKLGEVTTTAVFQVQSFSFTVPNTALLGSTVLRVRGANSPNPGLDPCFPYTLGETEDYAVVINSNTPQDCAGVNNGPALPGTACSDGNANTGNDTWNANCTCVGQVIDCAGVPGGTTSSGSPCDDGNANTDGDVYDANCQCAGLAFDCLGVPGGTAVVGTACDDNNAGTGNDVYNASCQCAGQLIDCLGVIGGTTTVGTPCDDGNPLSGGDAYAANCECVGAFANDCAGVEGGAAQPGTACDDNDGTTGNDTYSVNCVCAGEAYDCAGIAGGTQLPGTPCDDGNPDSNNDAFTADCGCLGELANDCAGVPGGTAQPGTTCDDGDADTGNDVYNAFCECAGQLIDCNSVAGGFALPGFPCDDGDVTTGNDAFSVNCQCAGLLLDCLGVPGGTDVVGTPCDDADANTSDDVYTANCICAGTLALDCEGVAGGTAQPGTTCDDGDANTGNDVYGANCACAGEVIDCEGTAGGTVVPGTSCDDGLACTANDVRGADCGCSGTTITIGAVTGASSVVGNTSNAFVITPIANATSYTWDLPNGWTTSDNGAFVLLAEANNTAGPVQVCVTAMVGDCELTSCTTVNVDFNTGIATNGSSADEWFTVQPNPSNGIFQLRPSTTDATPLRISIRNGLGQEVLAPFTVAGQRSIDMDLSDVAAGAYYLLATRNGEQQVIKIMVQR